MDQISSLRRAKEEVDEQARAHGNSLASHILGKEEAEQVSAANFYSGFVLDVNNYRLAYASLQEDTASLEDQWKILMEKHVKDVKDFQKDYQNGEFVMWDPEAQGARVGLRRNGAWLPDFVAKANQGRQRLRKLLGCGEADILQVNVLPFYTLGTLKKQVAEKFATQLATLKGISLVFYPFMPKYTTAKPENLGAAIGVGLGVDSQPLCPDSDADSEVHDFDGNGGLPEALTNLNASKTPAQRAAQLAADWGQIDQLVGLADTSARYPKWVTFWHEPDEVGEKRTTKAFFVYPWTNRRV